MEHRLAAVIAMALVLTAGASTASATAIYVYEGNNFSTIRDSTSFPKGTYTTDMRVTGFIEFSEALPPNSRGFFRGPIGNLQRISLSDGRFTLSTDDPTTRITNALVDFTTDEFGNIDLWQVSLSITELNVRGEDHRIQTRSSVSDLAFFGDTLGICNRSLCDSAFIADNPGTWTLIPEPGTGLLMMTGLLGLGFNRRRRA